MLPLAHRRAEYPDFYNRTADGNTLLLAAGQLVRQFVAVLVKSERM